MLVFTERSDGGLVQIGQCSVEATVQYIDRSVINPQPPPACWDTAPRTSVTVTTTTYATRLLHIEGRIERVVVLQEGDDPALLPGWLSTTPLRDLAQARMREGLGNSFRQTRDALLNNVLATPAPEPEGLTYARVVEMAREIVERSDREIAARWGATAAAGPLGQEAVRALARQMEVEYVLNDPARIAEARTEVSRAQERLHRHEQMMRMCVPPPAPLNEVEEWYGALHRSPMADQLRREFAAERERMDDALYQQMFGFHRHPRIDAETAARSKERARGLLKSLLTPQQWSEFEAAGVVTEQIEGCEFKLRPGGMIEARKARLMERWCVAPAADGWIPDEDKLIGQLLHLRAGPDKLREAANVFPGR